jgi:hypothetical protein
MDGTRNPCTEINFRFRRGDRTRTCDPWPPRLVLIFSREAEFRKSGFVKNWLE